MHYEPPEVIENQFFWTPHDIAMQKLTFVEPWRPSFSIIANASANAPQTIKFSARILADEHNAARMVIDEATGSGWYYTHFGWFQTPPTAVPVCVPGDIVAGGLRIGTSESMFGTA